MKNFKPFIAIMLAVALVAGIAFAETARLGVVTYNFNPTKIVTKTTTYTATISDSQINANGTGGAFTVTLPSVASALAGQRLRLKIVKTDATTNAITVSPATGDTVGGESYRKLLSQNASIVVSAGPGNDWTVEQETPYLVEDHEAGTYTTGIGSGGLLSTVTASTTLTASSCGNVIQVATDTVVLTLPATVANCRFQFINTGAAANNLITVTPNAADQIFGTIQTFATVTTMLGSPGQAISNTKATSKKGDTLSIIGDGADGWFISYATGTWAAI